MQQATLGYLIERLKRIDPEKEIRFDFVYLEPTRFASYRGFYDQLAIGYHDSSHKANGRDPTVAEFLEHCQTAVGKTFTGYKGGDYVMTLDTPVWVANTGQCASTAVADIIDSTYAIIQTFYKE